MAAPRPLGARPGGHPAQEPGTTGVLGGIRDLGHLVAVLKPYFAPSSLVPAPLAKGTGPNASVLTSNSALASKLLTTQSLVAGMNVTLTPNTPKPGQITIAATSTGPQVTVLTLVGGTVAWTFPNAYVSVPVVVASPRAAPAATPAEIFIAVLTNSAVTITSTLATDTRAVFIVAIGNPN